MSDLLPVAVPVGSRYARRVQALTRTENARRMLIAIHNRGVSWVGLGRQLDMNASTLVHFARDYSGLKITPERQAVIERLYRAFFPAG